MKKLMIYLMLLVLSIFIYFNLDTKKELNIPIKEQSTFPPKEYLKDLEKRQIQ